MRCTMCVFVNALPWALICMNAHWMASTLAHTNTYTHIPEHGLREPSTNSSILAMCTQTTRYLSMLIAWVLRKPLYTAIVCVWDWLCLYMVGHWILMRSTFNHWIYLFFSFVFSVFFSFSRRQHCERVRDSLATREFSFSPIYIVNGVSEEKKIELETRRSSRCHRHCCCSSDKKQLKLNWNKDIFTHSP